MSLVPPARAPEAETSSEVTEYELKASMLGHFLGYTTWPAGSFESASAPVRLLVVGKDPFGRVLDAALGKKKVGQRSIVVERVAKLPDEITAHAVFCGGLDPAQRLALIDLLARRPVLLVGDAPAFAADGGCVNFYLEGKGVRFEVNPDAAKLAGLSLSSEMMKLARLVKTRRER